MYSVTGHRDCRITIQTLNTDDFWTWSVSSVSLKRKREKSTLVNSFHENIQDWSFNVNIQSIILVFINFEFLSKLDVNQNLLIKQVVY